MEHNKKRTPAAGNEPNIFINGIIGGGIGIGVTLALILLFPIAALKLDDPNSVALPLACLCVFVGSGAGSFIAVKRCGNSAIKVALISSAVMILPMILVSFLIPGDMSIIGAVTVIAVIAAGALLTALAVTKFSASRKRNMKKVMKRR